MPERHRVSHLGLPVALALLAGIALISPTDAASLQQGLPSGSPANPAVPRSAQPPPQKEPQSDRVGSSGPAASAGDEQGQPVVARPRVLDAYNFEYPDKKDPNHYTAAIDDIVVLEVESLRALVNQGGCVDDQNNRLPNCEEQELMLFIERRRFPGNTLEALDLNSGEVQFHLRRTSENNEKWSDLLGDPPFDHRFFERPTSISIGLANGSPLPSDAKEFKLVRISHAWFWPSVVGTFVMLVVLVQLAIRSDILRDAGAPPTAADGRTLPKAYSLSRFQMAFWFVLVISSYVFVWLITDATDTLNTSVLALIGIGSGTALGSFAVDAGKTKAAASDGFLQDILSDATGICFYRFQMFVWTLVLGVIFISSVWYALTMPEFSATLLALQGISAGTYLGFKIPEKAGANAPTPALPGGRNEADS